MTDAEGPVLLCRTTRVGDRSIDLLERSLRTLEEDGAGRCQFDVACRSLEQHHAELTLQLVDGTRKRGLRDVKPISSVPEVQLLNYSHEIAQLPDLDRNVHSLMLTMVARRRQTAARKRLRETSRERRAPFVRAAHARRSAQ